MKTLPQISSLFVDHSPRFLLLAAITLFAFTTGCLLEPDRNNPSDPSSPQYNDDGMLSFAVFDRDNQPLQDAIVHLLGYDEAQYTNSAGETVFEVPGDTVYFTVERPGYVSQFSQVFVRARSTTTKVIWLNGEPFIDSVRVTTTMTEIDESVFLYGYQCRVYSGDYDTIEDLTDLRFYAPGAASPQIVNAEPEILIEEVISDTSSDLVNLIGGAFRFVLYDEVSDTAEATVVLNTHLFYKLLSDDMIPIGPHEYVIGDMDFVWQNGTHPHLLYTPNKYNLQVFDDDRATIPIVDTTAVFDFDSAQDAREFTINVTRTEGFTDGQLHYWQLTMFDLSGNSVTSQRLEFTPSSDIIGD